MQIASKTQSVQGNWNQNEAEAEESMIENLFCEVNEKIVAS